MKDLKVLIWLVSLTVLVGCGEGEKQAAEDSSPEVPPKPEVVRSTVTADNLVVVRIDGHDITRSDVIRSGKVMLHLNLNKLRRTKIGQGERKFLQNYCFNAVTREVGRAAIDAYLADRKLVVPEAVRASVEKDFVRRYGIRSQKLKRWHTIDDLKFMLGNNAFRVDIELDDLAKHQVATNDMLVTDPIVVSDEMVQKRLRTIAEYNANAQATNTLIFANASNLWHRIQEQEITFEDAAKAFSEDEYLDDGIEWGTFSKVQLEEETAVLGLLDTLKPGDITPPVESDDGLAILRLDEIDDAGNYSFSRIFFRLPVQYEEETEAVARQMVFERMKTEKITAIMKDYVGRLKLEYPNGPNIFAPGSPWAKLTAKDFNN